MFSPLNFRLIIYINKPNKGLARINAICIYIPGLEVLTIKSNPYLLGKL
jgi:hypothetical protein